MTQLINLYWRPGMGGAVISALLDYCTEEGGLDGYPTMTQGQSLHNHYKIPKDPTNQFYKIFLHGDDSSFETEEILVQGKRLNPDTVLAPIAVNNQGRILGQLMSLAKNHPINPLELDASQYCPSTYYSSDLTIEEFHQMSVGEKIETISLTLMYYMKDRFEKFHHHPYPRYFIDIMWFYNNEPEKISDAISQIGWHPKLDKIKKFCLLVLDFNKPYYDSLRNCTEIYSNVINKKIAPCALTFYETAIVHGLLMNHYNLIKSSQVKLINKIPTSTEDFFNLYD